MREREGETEGDRERGGEGGREGEMKERTKGYTCTCTSHTCLPVGYVHFTIVCVYIKRTLYIIHLLLLFRHSSRTGY